tara:strand:- start:372 stop:1097 length:726 start_codon:yes stop_codon:yes gene_type:complete
MISIYKKEISIFFSTIIGPLIIGLFLLINGLLLWSEISQFNILDNGYASMDIFFIISPIIFLVFVPVICMNTFSKEYNAGTIETLITKPLLSYHIVLGKFFAIFTLLIVSIIPTCLYIITIYYLGETTGNLDIAGIFGSYIGLIMLSGVFSSISIFASSISSNQITAFILGILFSSLFYFGFDLLSKIYLLQRFDIIIQKIGILYHYNIMSKGLLMVKDFIYFISIIFLFLKFSEITIKRK